MSVWWRELWGEGMGFVFGARCGGCGEVIDEGGGGAVCRGCEGRLLRAGWEACCGACGKLVGVEGAGCQECGGKGLTHIEKVARLTPYDEVTRALVLEMKFKRRWASGEYLGQLMGRHEGVRELVAWSEVVVPVPLGWRRRWGRGFNQAEVIARAMVGEVGEGKKLALSCLKRVRETEAQSGRPSATARAANVAGAFAVRDGGAVAGKRVLLVDDVVTTGATCVEAARTLKKAGAREVCVVAVAVVDRREGGGDV